MPTGTVSVFYRSKGYGFIRNEEDGKHIYVSRAALHASGLKGLRKGQRVEFESAKERGKFFAVDLHVVGATRTEPVVAADAKTFAGHAANSKVGVGVELEAVTKGRACIEQAAGAEQKAITDPKSFVMALPEGQGIPDPVLRTINESDREPITRAALEQVLTEAIRSAAPECEAFVGVIVEAISPKTSDGLHWTIKGARYGRANRDRCALALEVVLQKKQQQYRLTDDRGS